MRGLWPISLVVLAACDAIFGLGHINPEADAAVDTPPDMPDAACVPTILETPAIEDTQLNNDGVDNPANRFGGFDTMNVGQSSTSRVLLRFNVSTEMVAALAPTGNATMATLSLMIRTSGGACGAGCTTQATAFQVFSANNYWNEGSPTASYYGAAWHNRMQTTNTDGVTWSANGADGLTDRSTMSLATGMVATGATGTVDVLMPLSMTERTDISSRISGTATKRMSLILVPISGGAMFLYSREGGMPARLTVSICE